MDLFTLAPKFKSIFDAPFPAAVYNNSTTTDLQPPLEVKAGEVVATAVGLSGSASLPKAVFVDFGTWDQTKENEASKDQAFAELHSQDRMARIGLCWIDLLPPADALKVRNMQVSSQNRRSDFCTWTQ